MPNKSKPKPRTNWKARALLAELRLDVCNQAADVTKKFSDLIVEQRDKFEARALSAEKHNALLLEERELERHVDKFAPTIAATIRTIAAELDPPTHWQRFKSYFMAGLRGE